MDNMQTNIIDILYALLFESELTLKYSIEIYVNDMTFNTNCIFFISGMKSVKQIEKKGSVKKTISHDIFLGFIYVK